MKKQDMADKLAEGVRQARRSLPAVAVAHRAQASPSLQARFARQADQSPPPSLDWPWENLHPERIWPD